MYTHTVVVTIGRNIGGKVMPSGQWAEFKSAVGGALSLANVCVLQRPESGQMRAHDQVGIWEGQREGAATFVGLITGYQNINPLRQYLGTIARAYQQEAIGCIVTLGTDHLVYA